jgi:diguanylate cyclase (GGDEF)-like protein
LKGTAAVTPTQSEILAKLKISGKLPTPKGLALEVIKLTQFEDTSNQDIVHLISADPALGVCVIKAASMLIASTARPVLTISDAVSVLGFRALRQLVLSISLIENHQHGPCKQFNYAYFWAHSLLTAIAVRHLTERMAERAKLAAAEEIFTLGLLGGLGRLVMASVYPEEFGNLLEQAEGSTLEELYLKEQQLFGFEQAELSAAILADMNFPVIFQRLIHDYPQPQNSSIAEGSREWKLMNLLYLASLIANTSLAEPADCGKAARQLRAQAVSLAIEGSDIIDVTEKCALDWAEWTKLLNIRSCAIPSFAELFKQAENELEEIALPQLTHTATGYKMRVLLVEDDRAMRKLLEKLLIAAGHQVVVACNGIQALQLLKEERPQLIVTDWVMPEMDGISLCREVRANPDNRSIYLMVMTAYESPGKLLEAFESGADDYVYKPISPKMFYARLGAAQRVVQLQVDLASDREQLLHYSNELAAANERLQRQALTDSLTGLHNRRFAMERLEQEWALSKRGDRLLSCLMVDIDHFKTINDRFGHQIGDDALKLVANTLRLQARTQDVVCRYGGEEFLVICPDTRLDAARLCAERLRFSVAAENIALPDGSKISMTVSIGLAENNDRISSVGGLLIQADKNLYAAKAAGRNCIVGDE